jgi:hypothetical protein
LRGASSENWYGRGDAGRGGEVAARRAQGGVVVEHRIGVEEVLDLEIEGEPEVAAEAPLVAEAQHRHGVGVAVHGVGGPAGRVIDRHERIGWTGDGVGAAVADDLPPAVVHAAADPHAPQPALVKAIIREQVARGLDEAGDALAAGEEGIEDDAQIVPRLGGRGGVGGAQIDRHGGVDEGVVAGIDPHAAIEENLPEDGVVFAQVGAGVAIGVGLIRPRGWRHWRAGATAR